MINNDDVSIDLLPPELLEIKHTSYLSQNRGNTLTLSKVLSQIPPSKTLPDPLPDPPELPISSLSAIAKQIESESCLSYDSQSSLILQLKKNISNFPSQDSYFLLKKFRERSDIYATIEDEIGELISENDSSTVSILFNKKFQFIFTLFFLIITSFIIAYLNSDFFSKQYNSEDCIPKWFSEPKNTADTFYGIGISEKYQNIEVGIRQADNIARQDILSQIEKDNIKVLVGCYISNRHICSDGRVFSLAKLRKYYLNQIKNLLIEKKNKKILEDCFNLVPSHLIYRLEKYIGLIKKYSYEFDINTSLVLSIIHTESTFNPMARSSTPAYGLMQLVPSLCKDAYKYVYNEDREPSPKLLYDPEVNIRLGTAYLKLLRSNLKEIESDDTITYMIIAAYNTGLRNVSNAISGSTDLKKTMTEANKKSPDQIYKLLLRNLSTEEAKNFLRRVVGRMPMYSNRCGF